MLTATVGNSLPSSSSEAKKVYTTAGLPLRPTVDIITTVYNNKTFVEPVSK